MDTATDDGHDIAETDGLSPPKPRPVLGSLVRVDGREGYVRGITRAKASLYDVVFLDGGLRERCTDVELVELYPHDDVRLGKGLRRWISEQMRGSRRP